MKSIVKYNKGSDDCVVAFVFSCPGTEEKKNKKLVFGKTGENLNTILQDLIKQFPELFHSTNRYAYRITNASQIVHPNKGDKRTEPLISEITAAGNLKRLYNEIKNYKYVISFGNKAKRAVDDCLVGKKKKPIHIHYKYHLGLQSINRRIKIDIYGKEIPTAKHNKKISAENNIKRLKVVFSELSLEIQKASKSACPATSDQPS